MNSKSLIELIDDHIQSETKLEQHFQAHYFKGYYGGRVDALKMVKTWIGELEEKEKEK